MKPLSYSRDVWTFGQTCSLPPHLHSITWSVAMVLVNTPAQCVCVCVCLNLLRLNPGNGGGARRLLRSAFQVHTDHDQFV